MRWRPLILISLGLMYTSCTAMQPQRAARQQADTYYGTSYEQLSAREKMQLENHLARQSNEAWRTTAHLASGTGKLLQGVGVLVLGIKR